MNVDLRGGLELPTNNKWINSSLFSSVKIHTTNRNYTNKWMTLQVIFKLNLKK